MSINTALGRYFQLSAARLKEASRTAIRCPRGCKLAEVLEFPFRGEQVKALLVYANTRNEVTKRNPLGVNATALESGEVGSVELLDVEALTPEQMIDALTSGSVTEQHLEALYRARGLPLGVIAYVATVADLQPNRHSPNAFARCSHVSTHLTRQHFHARGRSVRLDATDNER